MNAILQEQKYTNQLMQVQAEKLVSIEKSASRCGMVASIMLGFWVACLLLGVVMGILAR